LSVEAVQLKETDDVVIFDDERFDGAVGACVSTIALVVTFIVLLAEETFPAASFAFT